MTSALTVTNRSLATALRPYGFSRKGKAFHRQSNDILHLVVAQASRSTADKITVNLGVWLPKLEESWVQPDIGSSHWSQRIGAFLPNQTDYWWTATTSQQVNSNAEAIADAVVSFGLPALDAISSATDLVAVWLSGSSPGLTDVQVRRYLARASGVAG